MLFANNLRELRKRVGLGFNRMKTVHLCPIKTLRGKFRKVGKKKRLFVLKEEHHNSLQCCKLESTLLDSVAVLQCLIPLYARQCHGIVVH